MAWSSMFELLESRMFLSATPLAAAQGLLQLAVTQLSADQATAASMIAAAKAKVSEDEIPLDLAPLQATLKQDQLARSTTLSNDRANLQEAVSNDESFILVARNDIRIDKAEHNTAQLKIDRAQLATDEMTLQTDRSTLTAMLESDIITADATIGKDKLAIADAVQSHKTTLAADKQTLHTDEQTWAQTIAADKKTIKADQSTVTALG